MSLKQCCIIDSEGMYIDLFAVKTEKKLDGSQIETVLGYTLKEGERLLDALPPTIKDHAGSPGFVKPRWDNDTETWVEGASSEELAAWEAEHPAPEVPEPSGNLEERVAALEQAQAEIWSAQAAAIREGVNSVE